MATFGSRVRFTARHGTRQVRDSEFLVEVCVSGGVQEGLVSGLDDQELQRRLGDLITELSDRHLDDVIGRATLENIALYVLHRLIELPVERVRVEIEGGWAEVWRDELEEGYPAALAFNRAVSLLLRNQADQALVAFDQSIALAPSARTHNARGRCLRALGRLSAAIEAFGRAIELDPECGEAYRNRGNALLECGRVEDSFADFDEAVRLMPGSALAINNRGYALAVAGEFSRALVDHTRATELDAGYEEAFRDQALALTKLSRGEEARAALDRASELKGLGDELEIRRGKLTLTARSKAP